MNSTTNSTMENIKTENKTKTNWTEKTHCQVCKIEFTEDREKWDGETYTRRECGNICEDCSEYYEDNPVLTGKVKEINGVKHYQVVSVCGDKWWFSYNEEFEVYEINHDEGYDSEENEEE
jgi:hypothetical protein